jgi:hypothetical protein
MGKKTDDESIHDIDSLSSYIEIYSTLKNINKENFGSYNDWRIPTIKELYSIVQVDSSIDKSFFEYIESSFSCPLQTFVTFKFWVSDNYTNINYYDYYEWFVSFNGDGVLGIDQVYNAYYCGYFPRMTRVVRGCQNNTNSYLIINDTDGTVTDINTGLMWTQKTSNSKNNWMDALLHSDQLTLAGYLDWRLPNRKELRYILDYNKKYPAIDTSIFSDSKSVIYWTSTTHSTYSFKAWCINFNEGADYAEKKQMKISGLLFVVGNNFGRAIYI